MGKGDALHAIAISEILCSPVLEDCFFRTGLRDRSTLLEGPRTILEDQIEGSGNPRRRQGASSQSKTACSSPFAP